IVNSFITVKDIKDDCLYDRRLSNGMIEGYNTTIEQLQFNAKGYSNFWRMRNRIIYVINKDYKIIDDKPIPVKKENRVPKNKKENKNKE
ncbi:MAG: transposase, partial [Bacilli bacterium]|nr:transposase [Bacilli bacterium]